MDKTLTPSRWTTQTQTLALTLIIFLGVVHFRVVHRGSPWTGVSVLFITASRGRSQFYLSGQFQNIAQGSRPGKQIYPPSAQLNVPRTKNHNSQPEDLDNDDSGDSFIFIIIIFFLQVKTTTGNRKNES